MDPFAANLAYPSHTFLDDDAQDTFSSLPTTLVTEGNHDRTTEGLTTLSNTARFSCRSYIPFRRTTLVLFAVLVYLGIADAGTHCKMAIILSYSTQILCDLPSAMQPAFLVDICDWTRHVHSPDSPLFSKCERQFGLFEDDKRGKAYDPKTPMIEVVQGAENPLSSTFVSTYPSAMVIPELTSPTIGLTGSSFYAHLVHQYSGYIVHQPQVFRPSSVLDQSVVEGECWQVLNGGHVGIRLNQSRRISHISLNYPGAHLLSSAAALKTPKDISVWGLVNTLGDLDTVNVTGIVSARKADLFVINGGFEFLPSAYFLKIAEFQYHSPTANPWQYSPVSFDMRFQVLVVVFESNYGAADTCIYSLGIHSL